ncbi:KR domain protein [Leptospira yanagawae serovar Saopaulo str. Sao Paulo = ATCC 700523]|uniref:KR domain protein n=1 Tax=Leptospira yanagawae serovar Saopaulo str. Sao Paulo = ATCC 700523 TaxID=1249483 RepID=A0A5E8HFA8_9LEPT|nr:SDR family oxidoreductase [Leptospira yanagawae]EOQ89964.1 KR domain protein [Leptospira yanagawae serovar Saopaulo str. Sao Paulo = ATCC 700523]
MNGKFALVTGASRGIGLSVSKVLLELGYIVYGVCRNPNQCEFQNPSFHLIECDLSNPKQIQKLIDSFPNQDKLHVIVNNAGFAKFGPIEELSPEKMIDMVHVNLLAPMLITNGFTRILKQNEGHIFFIGSVSGNLLSPWGNVYGSLKAGLHHFSRLLFDELRKYFVKVHLLIPDITKTDFYKDLNIEPDTDINSFLLPEQIATVVKQILMDQSGMIVPEIHVSPQLLKLKRKKYLK